MHLLYLDESGSATDPSQQHFVLAGISVFERQGHWIEQELNQIACQFSPNAPHLIELHGSPMRSGHGIWRRFNSDQRLEAIKEALKVAVSSKHKARLFGAVIKKSEFPDINPVEKAFEQLISRFDYYLRRFYTQSKKKNPQQKTMRKFPCFLIQKLRD